MDPKRIVAVFQLDTNRINARQRDADMNQLEAWHEKAIHLDMSLPAQREARAGGNSTRARKAAALQFALLGDLTEGERQTLGAIERILFPRGTASENEWNDVAIVFAARKWGRILLTNDGGSKRQPGGILGNREALAGLGVVVMNAGEAVRHVRSLLAQRDERARMRAQLTGAALPSWVGVD